MDSAESRGDELCGVAVLVGAAWVAGYSQRQRWRGGGVSGRSAAAFAGAEVLKFYALSRVTLSVAVTVYAAALAVVEAWWSSVDHSSSVATNAGCGVFIIMGVVAVVDASASDFEATAEAIHERFSRVSALQHLLLCTSMMVFLMAWINETYYAFGSRDGGLRAFNRVLFDTIRRGARPNTVRARAFTGLSAIAGSCSIFSEKCVAALTRTKPDSSPVFVPSALSLILLLTSAWLVMAVLESYWWQHAIQVDAVKRSQLLRSYSLAWVVLGFGKGVLVFDETSPDTSPQLLLGLLIVAAGMSQLSLLPPVEPKCDSSPLEDSSLILLDASQSLLPDHETLQLGCDDHGEDEREYRPPAQIRYVV